MGVDKDIVKFLYNCIKLCYEDIKFKIKVIVVEVCEDGLKVIFEDDKGEVIIDVFDKFLVFVGCCLNGVKINVGVVGVVVDECGFIVVDS